MATISITIPDAQLQRVIDAVCGTYNYDPNSGLTQAQFAKQQLSLWLKSTVRNWESNAAINNFKTTYSDPDVT